MCFSATASFSASAFLAVTGIAAFRVKTSRSQFFLAAIPILFAVQQFFEGILWLTQGKDLPNDSLVFPVKLMYLVFAFLIWPIWIPLALRAPEENRFRKKILTLNLIVGIMLAFVNLIYAINQSDVSVQIVHHSLQYKGNAPPQMVLYPLVTLLPCFISSLKNMWVLGMLITVAYIIAAYFFSSTFVSVWCFFSAIVSFSLYKILKDNPSLSTHDISSVIK